jgi:hypothetical protein
MKLYQNYPNPFNPLTCIRFNLSAIGNTVLTIYNLEGCLIRRFDLSSFPIGQGRIIWDGLDERNQPVSSSVYISSLTSSEGTQSKKMILIR